MTMGLETLELVSRDYIATMDFGGTVEGICPSRHFALSKTKTIGLRYMGSILFVQNIIVAWSKHEIYGSIFAIKIY